MALITNQSNRGSIDIKILRIDKEAFWQSLSVNPEKVLSPFWRTNRVPVVITFFFFQRRRKHTFSKNFVEGQQWN